MPFHVLCLSGGGFLGLYSAAVLASIEESSGIPLHRRFDLIAGTSIGGIVALGIASGTPASTILEEMRNQGPTIFSSKPASTGWIKSQWALKDNAIGAKYSSSSLRKVICDVVGEDVYIGDLKQRTIIPTVNLTKGSPQIFKTPHHESFVRDWKIPVVDVALATSAAPTFFPIHGIGGEMFADGGLYANSPDEIALHEAEHFLGQDRNDIRVLSIGTTTSEFSFSNETASNLGWLGWMREQRLPNVMIGAQQKNTDFMMRHRLAERYLRIDHGQSASQSRALALDVASPAAISNLVGLAEASIREYLPKDELQVFLQHEAPEAKFTTSIG